MRLFGLLLILAGPLFAQIDRANLDEGFDKPLKKTVLDFGPSPYYTASRHVRNKLTCYSYPTFTVKHYDDGSKGAKWWSIVRSANAACTRTHMDDEKVYTSAGYFRGVKGTFVFIDAADGEDGGMPFAVFDVRTGRKVFEDSSILERHDYHIKDAFRITSVADHTARLTYFRVVRAGCNLNTKQMDCWTKVRAEFGITQTDIPVCSGYEHADWESAVAYRVSFLMRDSPQIKAVDGPVFCWPKD